ncbi:hypothetical protein [Thalassobacillus pellis]|uniref:hypothetical protein n=1 Tax=Thalassobacillus pellis TaxID=748008 RepID=UPI0019611AC4|nr:hypothetical protein [Thalassobacillus pellis]MBM7554547.1 hypothetical protein [Thalassobacillus pellis]
MVMARNLRDLVGYLNDRYSMGFQLGMMGGEAQNKDGIVLLDGGREFIAIYPNGAKRKAGKGYRGNVADQLFPHLRGK